MDDRCVHFILAGPGCCFFQHLGLVSLNGLSPSQLRSYIQSVVVESAAGVLGQEVVDVTAPPLNSPLWELGIDSLGAVEFRNALSSKIGIKLPATTLFDYPTLNAIIGLIYNEVSGGVEEAAAVDEWDGPLPVAMSESLAVVSVSCRLPGARAQHIGKVVIQIPSALRRPMAGTANEAYGTADQTTDIDGCYVITGGFGGLGLLVADWLVEEGAKHIALVSRRGRPTDAVAASELWKKLTAPEPQGRSKAAVHCMAVDVSRKDECEKLFADLKKTLPPVRGIFHAAAVLDDAALNNQTKDKVDKVYLPKVMGAWYLHELSLDEETPLDHFMMFSSVAPLLGNFGQANYSAANSCLDALTEYRRSKKLAAQSIQWGPWIQQGMAVELKQHLDKAGMRGITNDLGLRVLGDVMRHSESVGVTCCQVIKWDIFLSRYDVIPPFFETVRSAATRRAAAGVSVQLRSMDAAALKEYIHTTVVDEAAAVLGMTEVPPLDSPLQELGIDSLGAVEFRNALSSKIGVKLPATTLFDYPTLNAIIDFIYSEVSGGAEEAAAVDEWGGPLPEAMSESLAVVMGAWYLHELSLDKETPLDHFMMFSSVASLLGNFGQANYSAANSCLDALTEYRRSKKLAAQSIQWGPWIQQGMAVELKQHLDKAGMRGITNDLGLRVLGDVMRHSESVGVTCCQVIKWDIFLSRYDVIPPFFETVRSAATRRAAAGVSVQLRSMDAAALKEYIHTAVVDEAAAVLGMTEAPPLDSPLQELGIDSLGAVEFRNALSSKIGVKLPATTLFDYPTLNAIIDFIYSEVSGGAEEAAAVDEWGGPLPEAMSESLAVVSVSCRLPGAGVLGPGRSDGNPLVLGALKTNIGHLEGAAGIAGLAKLIMTLLHGCAAPNLYFTQLNPYLDIEGFPVVFPTEPVPLVSGLPAKDRMVGGVSSFGFGGANAHVLVEAKGSQYVDVPLVSGLPAKDRMVGGVSSFGFGGANAHVLVEAKVLGTAQIDEMLNEKDKAPAALQKKIGFMFTGQGSQYVEMGRKLYDNEEVFRSCIDQCATVLDPLLPVPLTGILYPKTNDQDKTKMQEMIDQTRFSQPLIFAVEYSLAELLRSRGVTPDVVMGHSIGEYVAATIAGVMSLEDGLKLIAERARIMDDAPQNDGVMAACRLSEEEVLKGIASVGEDETRTVSVAAVNGPKSVVVSGKRSEVEAMMKALNVGGRYKLLRVSHAFHSPLMAETVAPFQQVLSTVNLKTAKIPLMSNVSGKVAGDEVMRGEYWAKHITHPVRFMDGMRAMVEAGARVIVEVGPRPTLIGMGKHCLQDVAQEMDLHWLAPMDPTKDDQDGVSLTIATCLAKLKGTHQWNHRSFPWVEAAHPALGRRHTTPTGLTFEATLRQDLKALIEDHVVLGLAAAQAERGAKTSSAEELVHLEEVSFERPLMLAKADDKQPEPKMPTLRVTVEKQPTTDTDAAMPPYPECLCAHICA
ncbi:unnamed protein product [Vitrella brassicaformis CCMP3155]|uniref:Carrier domain-containing protein n=1 Tax=Vitrella brassicaformis (strain CCMP3155) TaxID=1169540 RepID=A0A0G4FV47_VITBC|nr:unnamed protein product [Vitrella brassicaformis CCMP3155]|eukprot:CEM18786.1 unnamed protein product [Vitrella brassicaformis CCMP3155]